MRSLIAFVTLFAAACGSTRYGLESDAPKAAACKQEVSSCATECQLQMQHLPNGHCLITCTGPNGEHCEIELARVDGHCVVVRDDCADCCPAASEHVQQMMATHH
jgi:hypothetical protein